MPLGVNMLRLTNIAVNLNLPGLGSIQGTWGVDERQKNAAWELYIELVTRTTLAPRNQESGGLREALTSLHSLFATTREILKRYGPAVAKPKRGSTLSFAHLAVGVLNAAIRPVLSQWHPLLTEWESSKPSGTSSVEYERQWSMHRELRQELESVQTTLLPYAELLAKAAGVPPLIEAPGDSQAGKKALGEQEKTS